ncbi:MAG: phosphatidylglycerol lysyltransferase domain-containing protein [Eubacteriales bacterium]|nr:phosphatidylglycerol lysyltransferase domain-containing protein [Eubacteriales bacterium]
MSELAFKPITIEDKEWMTALLKEGHRGALEYNFTSNFIWREVYKLQAARFGDHLLVMSDDDNPTFIFPSGRSDPADAVRALAKYTSDRGKPLVFNTVLNQDQERLEALFPGQFTFEADRNDYDYVYEAKSLMTLKGKKLSGKRNHINRFMTSERKWSYESLSLENLEEARLMSLEWCREAGCMEDQGLFDESCAVEQAFKHFKALGLSGGLLRAGSKAIAFTMGEPLNEDTFLVHVEKAYNGIEGAYQMINQQFALDAFEGYQYANREDDAGDKGLRRAKLSYDPAFLVEKSSAELTGTI